MVGDDPLIASKRRGVMPELHRQLRKLVLADRYLVGEHAVERLTERGILEWQVVASMADGTLLGERPDAVPNPAVELQQVLPDGTSIKAVWSYVRTTDVAKLVTVHYLD
jgi:hypothetical protein